MMLRILSVVVLSCVGAHVTSAQSGSLDATFGTGGAVFTSIANYDDQAMDIRVQSDGRIVVCGVTMIEDDFGNGQFNISAVRYLANGTIDPAFGTVNMGTEERDEVITCMNIQADGKILLGGYSAPADDAQDTDMHLVRLNADGSPDASFGTDGTVISDLVYQGPSGGAHYERIYAVIPLADSKVLAVGEASNGFNHVFALLRYNADGTLDDTFGTGGIVNTVVGGSFSEGRAALVQPDGRIVVGGTGYVDTFGTYRFGTARYLATGALDPSYGSSGIMNITMGGDIDYITSLALDAEGRIIACGISDGAVAVARHQTNGLLDPSFGTGGKLTTAMVPYDQISPKILVQADGRLLITGTTQDQEFGMIRLNPNGSYDGTFGENGYASGPIGPNGIAKARSAALDANGKVLICGEGIDGFDFIYATARYLNELSVGVADMSENASPALIYPNPVHDEARFTYTLDTQAAVSIALLNNLSQVVRTYGSAPFNAPGTHTQVLDMAGLEAGIYHIVLTSAGKRATVQVTKN